MLPLSFIHICSVLFDQTFDGRKSGLVFYDYKPVNGQLVLTSVGWLISVLVTPSTNEQRIKEFHDSILLIY